MNVNVFICHTPFHNFITSRLCDGQFAADKNVILSSGPGLQTTETRRVITLRRGLINRIVGLNRARILILQLAFRQRKGLQIFLPHIDAVLGNYVFHSWLLKLLGVRINFYYDGMLMLDENRKSRIFPRFRFERTLLSLCLLHIYRFHKDILPVDSPRVSNIYSPIVEFTPAPRSTLLKLDLKMELFNRTKGRYVVLGTDVGSSAIRQANERIVERILNSEGVSEVFFKPHYSATTFYFEEAAAEKGLDFKQIHDKRCIEEIIADLKPEFLVAPYLSSALINIKLLCQDSIEVICLAHAETLFFSGKENMDIAAGFGIKILSFN